MNVRELTDQEIAEFRLCVDAGVKLLELDSVAKPKEIVDAIERYLLRHHQKRLGFFAKMFGAKQDTTQLALALGALWGDQLVGNFGWSWCCAQFEENELYCVASPDHAVAIFPSYFVKSCLDDAQLDCTIVLVWNMLEVGRIPDLPAGGLQNLMASVQRVVPRV